MDELWVTHLGRVPYRDGVVLQERLRSARQAGAVPDLLLLLEHDAAYTRGRRSAPDELPLGEAWYRAQGIDVVDTDRGGKVTYHGPGQLVGYPIMRIDDVVGYLRTMESALVAALADEGITAGVRDGLTGVWAAERKIGSIGVHVSHGVTTHGFALNVENDLQPFEWVVPCGLEGVRMTSVQAEHMRARRAPGAPGAALACFRKRAAWRFAEAFGARQRVVSAHRLERAARAAEPAAPVALAAR